MTFTAIELMQSLQLKSPPEAVAPRRRSISSNPLRFEAQASDPTDLQSALMLDEPHTLQRGMPIASDDDVVMHGDAQGLGDRDDVQGHLDVLRRWRRIARGMIVNKHDRC